MPKSNKQKIAEVQQARERERADQLHAAVVAPSANTTPEYFQASGRGSGGGISGHQISANHPVLQTAAGHRAVNLYARTIAGLPLRRFRGQREMALPTWLKRPIPQKPHITTNKIIHDAVYNGILEGNAFFHAPPDADSMLYKRPLALIPLDSDCVSMDIVDFSTTNYHVSTSHMPSQRMVIPQSQILHVIFYPIAGYERGVSPFRIAYNAVNTANAGLHHALGHLNNSARPSLAVKFRAGLDDEQYANLKKRLYEQHTGPTKAGKPLVFEEGTEVDMLAHDPRASQLVEQRELSAIEIGSMVGIPPMLMHVNTPGSVSYASAWAAIASWLRNSVEPMVRVLEEGLSRLLPEGERFEFSLAELLRGDVETRQKLGTAAVQGGWKAPNEQRAEEGLPPIEGADDLLWKQGMTPSRMLPQLLAAQQMPANQQSLGEDDVQEMVNSMISLN